MRPSGAPGALASASDRRHGTSSMSSAVRDMDGA
jgi:hypothetical protein